MGDAKNQTHSGKLSILQTFSPTRFVNEKASFSQQQQQQPDLRTCLNNSFEHCVDSIMSKFEDLNSKIAGKVLPELSLKGGDLSKTRNLMIR